MTARWAAADDDEDIGPFASELPAAPATGGPAPLPEWVKTHMTEATAADQSEEDGDDSDLELPEVGYTLESPEKGHGWEIYVEHKVEFLWQGEDHGVDGEECSEVMAQLLHAEKDAQVGKQKSAAAKARNREQALPPITDGSDKANKGPQSSAGKHPQSTAVPDDDFGGSSSDSCGLSDAEDACGAFRNVLQTEAAFLCLLQETQPPLLMPFVFTQDGKQWLMDAQQMRELALPGGDKTDGSDDWKVVQESIAGKIHYLLSSDTSARPRHCDVLLAGRKSKDIADPARKEAAEKHLAKHEAAVKQATMLKERRAAAAKVAAEAEQAAAAKRAAEAEQAAAAEHAAKAAKAEKEKAAAALAMQQQQQQQQQQALTAMMPPNLAPEQMTQLFSQMMTWFNQNPQGSTAADQAQATATKEKEELAKREAQEKEEIAKREAQEKEEIAKREAKEKEEIAKRAAREKAEREAKEQEERTQREAQEKAEREAKEQEQIAKREAIEKEEHAKREVAEAKEEEPQSRASKRAKTQALSPSLAANKCDLDSGD
ncbi:unnamed protein product [Symbiodinium microadriaticum]|nr:unnamed protein product [Symbiodinium sp. KB8]CAE7386077.1 unnamed protein product [Symbiodinium microadriaticum]